MSMRIVHINTNDGDDGVGRAAYRLHLALRAAGVDSSMFVQRQTSAQAHVTRYRHPRTWRARLRQRLRSQTIKRSLAAYQETRPEGYERFSDDRTIYQKEVLTQMPQAQLIHLHSIADFIDYSSFFRGIANETNPIVWTLHDMEPFTGGCHYDFGCGRFTSGCGACPQLGSDNPKDLSHQVWERKERIFSQIPAHRLHIVALNQWMADEVAKSPLLNRFSRHIIPNGVNLEDFAPRPRNFARNTLGIPQEARVLLYVASSMKTRRKGFHILAQAVKSVERREDLFLLSLGSGQPNLEVHIPHLHIGSVYNDRLLSLIYSAADVFVLPSLQDNLPNTVLEAMACGTPVLASNVGGIPDVIQHGHSGILVPPADALELGQAIAQFLSDSKLVEKISSNSRKRIAEHFSQDLQAKKTLEMYQLLVLEPPHSA